MRAGGLDAGVALWMASDQGAGVVESIVPVHPISRNRAVLSDGVRVISDDENPLRNRKEALQVVNEKDQPLRTVDAKDYKHPIVSLFAGADSNVIAGLTGAKTWQYHKLNLPAERRPQAQVALWFNTGDPATVAMSRHRRTVTDVAPPADTGCSPGALPHGHPPTPAPICRPPPGTARPDMFSSTPAPR